MLDSNESRIGTATFPIDLKSVGDKLNSFASRAANSGSRQWLVILTVWSIVFFLITGLLAATKLLWADELTTSYLSQKDVSTIWGTLLKGGDAHPPLSFFLVHLSYSAFGVNHLSGRLPFIIAFWTMSICIFFFVQKRCGALYGLAAMSLPLLSTVYPYSYESRPYALLLARAQPLFFPGSVPVSMIHPFGS